VRVAVLLALAGAIGAVSYRFVELPFLRLKVRRRRPGAEFSPSPALATPPAQS